MDERLQELIREARAADDPESTRRAVTACERAGQGAPGDLADEVVWPGRTIESEAELAISAEARSGAVTWAGRTPGSVELGEHRWWFASLRPEVPDGVWEELERLEVPGLHISAPNKESPELVARAASLPSLRRLSLTGGAADGALATLGASRLVDLHVDSLKATKEGVSAVHAPHLVRLSLSRSGLLKDLGSLGDMSLRRLSLNRMRSIQKLVKSMPVLPDVTHLELYDGGTTARILTLLREKLPGLRELQVTPKKGQGTKFMKALAGFSGLESLTLHRPRLLERADLSPLKVLTQLRSLDLHAADVTGLEVLAELPALRRLVLSRPDDRSLGIVKGLGELRELALLYPEPGTTAEGLAAVAHLERLERLDLQGDRFESADELLDAVQGMCPSSLRRLRFVDNWDNATAILGRLDLPGVELLQERLDLPGQRGEATWVVA